MISIARSPLGYNRPYAPSAKHSRDSDGSPTIKEEEQARHTSSCHRPRKQGDPVFRSASDGAEKLRRTGYSAFAEYDDFLLSIQSVSPPHLASTDIGPVSAEQREVRCSASGTREKLAPPR